MQEEMQCLQLVESGGMQGIVAIGIGLIYFQREGAPGSHPATRPLSQLCIPDSGKFLSSSRFLSLIHETDTAQPLQLSLTLYCVFIDLGMFLLSLFSRTLIYKTDTA
jgi:hypothetical protein